ncbi:MAG: hypothetical protein WAZ18_01580 [Alphaproteobacteria bacterium]
MNIDLDGKEFGYQDKTPPSPEPRGPNDFYGDSLGNLRTPLIEAFCQVDGVRIVTDEQYLEAIPKHYRWREEYMSRLPRLSREGDMRTFTSSQGFFTVQKTEPVPAETWVVDVGCYRSGLQILTPEQLTKEYVLDSKGSLRRVKTEKVRITQGFFVVEKEVPVKVPEEDFRFVKKA